MTKLLPALAAGLMTFVAPAVGQEPSPRTAAESEPTQATYLLTGLHCPPCTRTVEASLAGVKGILAIKVDWKTKTAHIEFDETVLPAQSISRFISATPHMMGGAMHYGGWLALNAPGIKDEATARQAEEALSAVEGVKTAKAYPAQHTIAAYFSAKGDVTTRQKRNCSDRNAREASGGGFSDRWGGRALDRRSAMHQSTPPGVAAALVFRLG